MLVTVIVDAFRQNEAPALAFAINDICAATDHYGWSSAGLYCFWDYYTRDIYYIGLAEDLALRFKQHTGLTDCNPKGCKAGQIRNYFLSHECLGYSIFVQASQMQPATAQVQKKLSLTKAMLDDWPEDGMGDVKLNEGWLIKAHERLGEKPQWNSIGGSRAGAACESSYEVTLLGNMTASQRGPLLAHSSIREISDDNAPYAWYEELLHGARMRMVLFGVTLEAGLQMVRDEYEANIGSDFGVDELIESGYLTKVPSLPDITTRAGQS